MNTIVKESILRIFNARAPSPIAHQNEAINTLIRQYTVGVHMKPSDNLLGWVDTKEDVMYCLDDFGNLMPTPWHLFNEYFQEH